MAKAGPGGRSPGMNVDVLCTSGRGDHHLRLPLMLGESGKFRGPVHGRFRGGEGVFIYALTGFF